MSDELERAIDLLSEMIATEQRKSVKQQLVRIKRLVTDAKMSVDEALWEARQASLRQPDFDGDQIGRWDH